MNTTNPKNQGRRTSATASPSSSRRGTTVTATPPTGGAAGLGLLGLSGPAARIAGAATLGVPLAPIAGWLSIVGEAGLGLLLIAGLATRVAGALAAALMTVTWIATAAARGVITDQPGITAENALLIAAIGLAMAVLGGGRFTLANALRLPKSLQ